jgi:hypothetical protein
MSFAINPLAVLAAAAATFVIGGLWYSVLFAKPWQKAAGVSDEALTSGAARIFIGSALLALVMAVSLAAFIGSGGAVFGLLAGLAAGLTWVAAAFGVNYLFERRPLRLWLINGGYNVIVFGVMGVIIGAMQA